MAITLYGAVLSPFVRKVRVALDVKALTYERVHVDPFKLPNDFDYQEISPLQRIPALQDGDFSIADSAAIAAYLDAKYPGAALYPSEPEAKAQAIWFEKFGDYELAPVATFRFFRNRVVMPLLGRASDEDAYSEGLNTLLPPLMDYLESQLNTHGFIVGDTLCIADIAIASQFVNMSLGQVSIDTNRWPKAAAYNQRVLEATSMGAISEEDHARTHKILERVRG